MKVKQIYLITAWMALVLLSRFIKLSIPCCGLSATILCSAVVLPTLAYFMPGVRSLPLVGGLWLFFRLLHPVPLTAGIPTLLATLSWGTKRNVALHIGFPLLAMALFTFAAPQAWAYTLFWLIPVACTFIRPTLLSRALQSTFIAHAAGSLIWVFCVPLTSGQWLSLIPVVAVERLIAASLSVGVIGLLSALPSHEPLVAGK